MNEQVAKQRMAREAGLLDHAGLLEWFGTAPGVIARLDADGMVMASNRRAEVPSQETLAAHFDFESSTEIEQALARAVETREAMQIEVSRLGSDGVRHWFALEVQGVWQAGELCGFGVHGVEVSARKREEDRLRRSESMLVDTQGVAHLGVWDWDITQPVAVWSPELYRIYGETPESYLPTYEGYLEKVHPEDRQRVMDATNEAFNQQKPYSHDERIIHSSGEIRYLHTWAFPVLNDLGELIRLTGVCQDITDRKRAELERDRANELALSAQRLSLHRAQFDELTRLPNRSKFHDDLLELLHRATVTGERRALVTMGLDHFSELNNALGPKVGDIALSEVAERLRKRLPALAVDTLARTGPDLFSWVTRLAAGARGLDALVQECEALLAALSAPLELGHGFAVSASMGCALFPDHAGGAEELLYASDTALHWAKKNARGFLKIYQPEMQQQASRVLELSRELHGAMDRGELSFHYQPIVAMAGMPLLGVEALARWQRQDGSTVPPDHFIPVAESGDLLRPFTEWTIDTVCAQMADWRRRGVAVPKISFNLSAAQMRLGQIDDYILASMQRHRVPGRALTLEITEGALLENMDVAKAMLDRLRSQGLSIAVDDFGVGYASPHYLRALPVNILKIDGSFLKDVPQDKDASSLLNGIIEIGRSLQLGVVTECVEHAEQADYLRRRGSTSGQGYWFSPALPAARLEDWLAGQRASTAA